MKKNVDKDVKELDPSYIAGKSWWSCSYFHNMSAVPQKFLPTVMVWGKYSTAKYMSKRDETHIHTTAIQKMSIGALFTVSKNSVNTTNIHWSDEHV